MTRKDFERGNCDRSRNLKSKSIESRQTDCVEDMTRAYVLRARSRGPTAGLTTLEMGPAREM